MCSFGGLFVVRDAKLSTQRGRQIFLVPIALKIHHFKKTVQKACIQFKNIQWRPLISKINYHITSKDHNFIIKFLLCNSPEIKEFYHVVKLHVLTFFIILQMQQLIEKTKIVDIRAIYHNCPPYYASSPLFNFGFRLLEILYELSFPPYFFKNLLIV